MFLSFQPHIYERNQRAAREASSSNNGRSSDGGSLSPSSSAASGLTVGELQRQQSHRSGESPLERAESTDGVRSEGGDRAAGRRSLHISRSDSGRNNASSSTLLSRFSLNRSRRNVLEKGGDGDAREDKSDHKQMSDENNGEEGARSVQLHPWLDSPATSHVPKRRGSSAFLTSARSGSSSKAAQTLEKGGSSNTRSTNARPSARRAHSSSSAAVMRQRPRSPPIGPDAKDANLVLPSDANSSSKSNRKRILDSAFTAAPPISPSLKPPDASADDDRLFTPATDEPIDDLARQDIVEEQGVRLTGDNVDSLQSSLARQNVRRAKGLFDSKTAPGNARGSRSGDFDFGQNRNPSAYPLPVRLGLVSQDAVFWLQIPSDHASDSAESLARTKVREEADFQFASSDALAAERLALLGEGRPQYRDGYYLVTPPPRTASQLRSSAASSASLVPSLDSIASSKSRPKSVAGVVRPGGRKRPQSSGGLRAKGRGRSSSNRAPTLPREGREMQTPVCRDESLQAKSMDSGSPEEARDANAQSDQVISEPKRWNLHEYFRKVERQKKPGRFGVVETKMHAFPSANAPYFLTYGKNTMTAEVMVQTAVDRIIGSTRISWNGRTPRRVLDLGCGCGVWVMEMAKRWPDAEFVGLDLVPCQTPLDTEPDFLTRVSWVVANILEGLPFADGSFDYVHISFLNSGIPEGKWMDVLQDIMRIIVPDGHLEILEVDWTFYGAPMQMYKSDYDALLSGRLRNFADVISTWESYAHGKSARKAQRYADLARVIRLPYERRKICLNPTVFLPACLTSLKDEGDAALGNVRRIPILARSRLSDAYEAAERAKAQGKNDVQINQPTLPEVVQDFDAFVTHADPSRPTPRHHFLVEDMDALRLAILGADILRNSELKELFWAELEAWRKTELRQAEKTPRKAASRRATSDDGKASDVANSRGTHPQPIDDMPQWLDFGQFERDMDQWATELRGRTDVELLLKNLQRWDEAAERIDGWMLEDKQSKQHRKRRWAAGSTPFVLSLSSLSRHSNDLHQGGQGDADRSRPPFVALSGGKENEIHSNDSALQRSTSPVLEMPELASIDSDEDSSTDDSNTSTSSILRPAMASSQVGSVREVEQARHAGDASPTLPRITEEHPRESKRAPNKNGQQYISLLGFRNICAWSFHKLPVRLPPPDKELPPIPPPVTVTADEEESPTLLDIQGEAL